MIDSLDDLIRGPEQVPWLLSALHVAKVALLSLAVMSFLVGIVGGLLGFGSLVWIYAFLALIAGATVVALLANRWSESLFVRRAQELGFNRGESQSFWRTYDWDAEDA